MNALLPMVYGLLALCGEVFLRPALGADAWAPDLMTPLLVWLGMNRSLTTGAIVAAALGLLADGFAGSPLGTHMLHALLLFYSSAILADQVRLQGVIGHVLMGLAGGFVGLFLLALISRLLLGDTVLAARIGDPIDCGNAPDDRAGTRAAFQRVLASEPDLIISTGGVSVGDFDVVKDVLVDLGVEMAFWKVAMKPGKPLAFGRVGDTPFIGLPGNPSSVFVTFCLVARPFLLRLQGVTDVEPPRMVARADFEVRRAGSRQDYLRVTVRAGEGGLIAERFPNQSSGVLSSVSHSNALR